MSFSMPGFEPWRFEIVLLGSRLVLEATRDDQILSTVLAPLDSTASQAHALISSPRCALVACRHGLSGPAR